MKTIPFLFLCFILTVSTAYAGNPRLRENQIRKTVSVDDVKAEIEFGREVAARIIGKYPLLKNDRLTRYVNLVAKALAMNSNRPELEFTVGILDTDMINGFSAPGGFIFITKGAIDSMEDEAELAGAISHEMVHVLNKHIVKELNIRGSDSTAVSGLGRIIGGAADPTRVAFTKGIDQALNILFERGYKRADEIEADTQGVILAAAAGYDPQALIRFFNRIKIGTDEVSSLKALHPSFEERIGWIEKTIEKEGLSEGEFKTAKERFHENTNPRS